MRRLRLLAAISIAFALVLGGSGYLPKSVDGGRTTAGDMAAMTADGAMPGCPRCDPDGGIKPICASSCTAPAAILAPVATVLIVLPGSDSMRSAADRLDGAAAGPEPHPPKLTILA